MAGEWLKFEKATPDKPEVFAIAGSMDIDPDAVVGKLIRVWSWFDTHTIDGNGRSVTPSLLDRIAGVSGFVAAMASVGWLVISDEGVSLPNFDRHTGETAKGRALTAKRVANHKEKGNAKGNAASVSPALPREEKRREEETHRQVCPQQQVIALYHEVLPELPPVREWTGEAELRARWRSSKERQSLDWWRTFFEYVKKSPFLMGERGDFQASLAWIVKAGNFAKIVNGNYEDRGR